MCPTPGLSPPRIHLRQERESTFLKKERSLCVTLGKETPECSQCVGTTGRASSHGGNDHHRHPQGYYGHSGHTGYNAFIQEGRQVMPWPFPLLSLPPPKEKSRKATNLHLTLRFRQHLSLCTSECYSYQNTPRPYVVLSAIGPKSPKLHWQGPSDVTELGLTIGSDLLMFIGNE